MHLPVNSIIVCCIISWVEVSEFCVEKCFKERRDNEEGMDGTEIIEPGSL